MAAANEYLVRTGIMIDDIDICKQALHFPFQTMTRINMHPITYNCLIEEAMSQERISFNLPTVFTVGPEDNDSALKIYSKLILGATPEELESQVHTCIHAAELYGYNIYSPIKFLDICIHYNTHSS